MNEFQQFLADRIKVELEDKGSLTSLEISELLGVKRGDIAVVLNRLVWLEQLWEKTNYKGYKVFSLRNPLEGKLYHRQYALNERFFSPPTYLNR